MFSKELKISSLIAFLISTTCSFGQSTWLDGEPFMALNVHSQVLFANNCFIANDCNRIFTTTNGQTWNRNASVRIPDGCWENGISYCNNQYVALGDRGFAFSSDLVTWDSTKMDIYYYFCSIAYGNGRYVLCGQADGKYRVLYSSSDRKVWSSDTLQYNANSIVFANNQFVVAGKRILTSPDGINWTTQQFIPQHTLRYVTFVNDSYFAVGDSGTVIMSNDGVQWVYKNAPIRYHLISAGYGNGMYVVSGDGNVLLTSKDCVNWNEVYFNPDYMYGRYFVSFGNNQFLAVGLSKPVMTSLDGITWQELEYPDYSATYWGYKNVNYCNDRFISVGSGGYYATSGDGEDWTIFPADPNSRDNKGNTFYSAAYGAGKYVILGDTSLISSNGTDWSKIPSGQSGSVTGTFMTFEQNKFIALNGSHIWTSGDGLDWKKVTVDSTIPSFTSLAYGNDNFVAVGGRGQPNTSMNIFTSKDAQTWSPVTVDTANGNDAIRLLNSVAFGNNMFVSVGGHCIDELDKVFTGYILYSADSKVWSRVPLKLSYKLTSVTYGSSHFVAVGDSGVIFSSTDGVTWTKRKSDPHESLFSAAYGKGRFVTVGVGNYLNRSDRLTYMSLEDDSNRIHENIQVHKKDRIKISISNDIITITIPRVTKSQQVQVCLFSVAGKKVYQAYPSTAYNGILIIPTNGFARGIYVLKVLGLGDSDQFSSKIMIAR